MSKNEWNPTAVAQVIPRPKPERMCGINQLQAWFRTSEDARVFALWTRAYGQAAYFDHNQDTNANDDSPWVVRYRHHNRPNEDAYQDSARAELTAYV